MIFAFFVLFAIDEIVTDGFFLLFYAHLLLALVPLIQHNMFEYRRSKGLCERLFSRNVFFSLYSMGKPFSIGAVFSVSFSILPNYSV